MPATVALLRGISIRSRRAISTRRAPPITIRAAPTATGDAAGPMACAVPVVPKQTAARSTWRRAGIRAIVEQYEAICQGHDLAFPRVVRSGSRRLGRPGAG